MDANRVYFFHPKKEVWALGTIDKPGDKKTTVNDSETGEKVVVDTATQLHRSLEHGYDPREHDLFSMNDLHQATLLYCVGDRFTKLKQQYTRMGEIVLSVNPFEPMPYNTDATMQKYVTESEDAPHAWQIAHRAFRNVVIRDRGNQSVLISGESGAGKTETTKMLMKYIGRLSFQNSSNAIQREVADSVNKRLTDSNPILESFGNAKTVRNDNSSRFGKYIKLYLNARSGVIVGAQMVTYLLEKSRIIGQSEGERGYHVFYEMLAGLSPQDRAEFKLQTAQDYRATNGGNMFTRRGTDGQSVVNDADSFKKLNQAMEGVGIQDSDRKDIWAVLAAILHLQNVKFGTDSNTGKAKIDTPDILKTACGLLCIDADAFGKTLLIKSATNIMTTLSTQAEAEDMRDAVSKALYQAIFDWLVTILNSAIAGEQPTSSAETTKYIGLLDIFGFENFTKNSFEQLCINYANEGLQNHYNKYTFVEDAAECEREGIACPVVAYPDNGPCVELIQKTGTGVLAVLDAECQFKLGTDEGFTKKAWEQHGGGKSPFFIQPKSTDPTQFGVRHYAGDVTYTTKGWLEKNADTLKEDVREVMSKSSRSNFVRGLLPVGGAEAVQGGGTRRPTVGKKFKSQLESLLAELSSTESHFIRCIKPNSGARPGEIEAPYVLLQLNSSGVLSTISMKREGFPIRLPVVDFVRRFRILGTKELRIKTKPRSKGQPVTNLEPIARDCAAALLSGWTGKFSKDFAIGKTKVFMRPSVLNALEKLRQIRIKRAMRAMQPVCLDYIYRKRAERERLKKLQEEQERERARQPVFANNSAEDVRRAAAELERSGASNDVVKVFEELAVLFPHFDSPVILDVATSVEGNRETAIQWLMDMQRQRIDQFLPRSMKLILDLAGLSTDLQERMAAKGFSTRDFVFAMTEGDMDELGFTPQEKSGLRKIIMAQQSNWVAQQRMDELYHVTPLGSSDSPLRQSVLPVTGAAASSRGGPHSPTTTARLQRQQNDDAALARQLALQEEQRSQATVRQRQQSNQPPAAPVESDEEMARRLQAEIDAEARAQTQQPPRQAHPGGTQPRPGPATAPGHHPGHPGHNQPPHGHPGHGQPPGQQGAAGHYQQTFYQQPPPAANPLPNYPPRQPPQGHPAHTHQHPPPTRQAGQPLSARGTPSAGHPHYQHQHQHHQHYQQHQHHQHQPPRGHPPPSSAPPMPAATQPAFQPDPRQVRQLMEFTGVDEQRATAALRQSRGDVEGAAQLLLG